ARLCPVGTTQRNEKAIQSSHGTEECAVVGSASARIPRTQSRYLWDRSCTVQKGRGRFVGPFGSAGQNECDGPRALVRRTDENGADFRTHSGAARPFSR